VIRVLAQLRLCQMAANFQPSRWFVLC